MPATKISIIHRVVPYILQTLIWIPTRLAFRLFGHFEVYGHENLKGMSQAIFAVNHASEFDPIVLTAAFNPFSKFSPMFYVAAPVKMFSSNDFGWRRHLYSSSWFFRAWGAHPIIRGVRDYEKSLHAHLQILRHGKSLCIFPEGGITKTGELGEPKGGVIHLANETNVPVIPVAITGTYKITPRLFFRGKRHIIVSFGEPILSNQISKNIDQYHHEAELVFSRINNMLANDAQ